MTRYWIIAPIEANPPEQFERTWQFDLANNVISIGWAELGDVSRMNKQQLSNAVALEYPDKPPGTKGLITNMVWAFYHEIVPGDFVIARRGLKALVSVGEVVQSAVYSPGKIPNTNHANILGVSWQSAPRDKTFPDIMFLRPTLTEISSEEFQTLVKEEPRSREILEAIEDTYTFGLERHLEEFMVSNFQKIFGGKLQIYKDDEGNGQQYKTEIGSIDILALEPESNSFVVIELKKARPSDQVVGQILRYMGWVKKNLCKKDQVVRGLVICNEPDPKLSYALDMTQNIGVRYYNVSFDLSENS